MDFTPELANTPARPTVKQPVLTPRQRWRKFTKRAIVAAIGLVVILLVVFFMLPVWISNEQGRAYVLSHINKRINGTLAVGGWKLGWFRGTEIENLTLTLPDGKTLLRCPRIQTDLTLWSLLWNNYDLGNTRLDAPQLTAARYADGTNDFTRLVRPDTKGPNPLQTLRGNIVCVAGTIELSAPGAATPLTIRNLRAEVPIASQTAGIHLRADGMAGGRASDPVSLVADLPGPATWAEDPLSLLLNVRLVGGGIPTAALAQWIELDPRWEKSLGTTISHLVFTSQPQDPGVSMVTVKAAGDRGSIDAKVRMIARGRHVALSLPPERGPALSAVMAVSEPAVGLLRRVNPVLGEIEKTEGPIIVQARELEIDLREPSAIRGTLFMQIPPATMHVEGLLAQVLAIGRPGGAAPRTPPGTAPATQKKETVPAAIDRMKLILGSGRVEYTDLGLTFASRQRLVFSGNVRFDGRVDLLLTLPVTRPFGSTTLQVPIRGTADRPKLELIGP